MDVSAGMLTEFISAYKAAGVKDDDVTALNRDLLVDGAGEHEGVYDVVICSMALHHFADPKEALKQLTKCVKVGGVVVIIDWGAGEKDEEGVVDKELKRAGDLVVDEMFFGKEKLVGLFGDAGCGEVEVLLNEAESEVPGNKGMRLTFAKGVRA